MVVYARLFIQSNFLLASSRIINTKMWILKGFKFKLRLLLLLLFCLLDVTSGIFRSQRMEARRDIKSLFVKLRISIQIQGLKNEKNYSISKNIMKNKLIFYLF